MTLLNNDEIKRLEAKIAALETLTTSEIKIIICRNAWFGLKHKAHKLFKKYKLHETKERNAVLLLLEEKNREFLIYGDEGIHQKVGNGFWEKTGQSMQTSFQNGEIANGLSTGLHIIAEALAQHYPGHAADINEISNEIIFEK